MVEKWIKIVGYEDLYQVGNRGSVKSSNQKVRFTHSVNKKEYFRNKNGKVLKQTFNVKTGYKYITLHKPLFKIKTFSIHRLVAIHFIKNENKYDCINHIDFNKTNNNVDNLEWCSHKQNCAHAKENNLYVQGENHYKSILSDHQILEIRKSKKPISQLAKDYCIQYKSMWQIVRGLTRRRIHQI